nr:protein MICRORCHIDIA 7-like isoform X2 [Ipomoea batatas]
MGNPKHRVKKEIIENHGSQPPSTATMPMSVIDISSSDSDSDSEDGRSMYPTPSSSMLSCYTESLFLPAGATRQWCRGLFPTERRNKVNFCQQELHGNGVGACFRRRGETK